MSYDRLRLIPAFQRFCKTDLFQTVVNCQFCGTDCLDFVPISSGIICHECVDVCAEIVLHQSTVKVRRRSARRRECSQ